MMVMSNHLSFPLHTQIESDKRGREGKEWIQEEQEAFKQAVARKYDEEASPW